MRETGDGVLRGGCSLARKASVIYAGGLRAKGAGKKILFARQGSGGGKIDRLSSVKGQEGGGGVLSCGKLDTGNTLQIEKYLKEMCARKIVSQARGKTRQRPKEGINTTIS